MKRKRIEKLEEKKNDLYERYFMAWSFDQMFMIKKQIERIEIRITNIEKK